MRLSLRNKFLVPTLALIIIGMGLSSVVSFFNGKSSLEGVIKKQVEEVAAASARQISSWLTEREINIQMLAVQGYFVTAAINASEFFVQRVNAELKSYLKKFPFYELLAVVNQKGLTVAASLEKVVNKVNIKDRGYFQEAMKGKTAVSKVILSRSSGRPVVVVAAPLKRGKEIMGAFLGVVDLAAFTKHFIDPIRVGKSGYVYVVTAQGKIIAHPNKNLILKMDISRFDWGRKILETKRGVIEYEFQGKPQIAAYDVEKKKGWIVVATADRNELLAPVRELGLINGSISLVVVLLGALIIFLVARSVTGPVTSMIAELLQGASQVSLAAEQVSQASQSLAEGTSQQAASLEETASSLEEIASMTRNNAENAGQADALMRQTREVMSRARESMKEMISSMEQINQASEEISKIVKSIDEIAFQTNLLALNAAVEAARAGEAGAGFAVVADEVRNLAMRAAEAAKNTESLIQTTVERVKAGSQILERTDQEYREVATNEIKVAELVAEISSASKEQSDGIEQINKAVSEMDQVTQRNAATAEESASTSEELSAQSEVMRSTVQRLAALVSGAEIEEGATFTFVQEPEPEEEEKKPRRRLLPWRSES